MSLEPRVGEVCSRRYVTVSRRRRVVEVARAMAGRWMPCVVVVEEGIPVGIITKQTLVKDVLARGYTGMELTAGDVMRAPIVTVDAGVGARETAALMARTRLRYLAVTDRGRLVGLLSEGHVARLLPSLTAMDPPPPGPPHSGAA